MRNLDELKLRPRRGNPYGPPDESNIRLFEERFGITFPPFYIQFLKYRNGGSSTGGSLRLNVNGVLYGINDFFGLGPDDEPPASARDGWQYGNLWHEAVVTMPVLGSGRIAFARDGGGNLYFLDFNFDPPSVGYFDSPTRKHNRLFADFESFVDAIFLSGRS